MPKSERTVLVIPGSCKGNADGQGQLRQDLTGSYQVLTASNDSQALVLCRSQVIECIVFELNSGQSLNFLSQLQEQLGEQCPPMVVIGKGEAAMVVQAFKQGATDYLIQDQITPEELCSAIDKAIADPRWPSKLSPPPKPLPTPSDRKELAAELSQTIAALQASQQRYRDLAAAMPQIIWTADATGAVNYWNQRWYEYTGLQPADSMGQLGVTTVHPQDRDRTLEYWNQAIAQGEAFEIEYRLRRWDGVYRWFISRALPTRNPQGQINGWIGTITEIDHQKQLEAKLLQELRDRKQAEERYRTLFESMAEGFCVVEMLFDQHHQAIDYRFLEINPVFEQQTGLQQAEGKTARQLLPNLEPHWFEIYGKVALTGEPIRFEHGSEVMNRWFEVSAFRVGHPEHHKVAILFKEISQRRRAEQELQASEERFRTLADNISQFAWMADKNGWIFWYNQRWFDYTGTTLDSTTPALLWNRCRAGAGSKCIIGLISKEWSRKSAAALPQVNPGRIPFHSAVGMDTIAGSSPVPFQCGITRARYCSGLAPIRTLPNYAKPN